MESLIKQFLHRNQQEQYQKRRVVHVLGDALIDEYYQILVSKVSPEAPALIIQATDNIPCRRMGGAANVASQFKHFNVDAQLICLYDENFNTFFNDCKIKKYYQKHKDANFKLPIKQRFLEKNVQVIRHDIELPLCGVNQEVIEETTKNLILKIPTYDKPDIAILSDYDKGFFKSKNHNILDAYRNCITIVDSKNRDLSKWKGCTIFKPNASEAEKLTGKKTWQEQAKCIQNELQCQSVVITHADEHVAGIHKNKLFCYEPSRKVKVSSVVGAGDNFSAFLAMAITCDFDIPEAVEIAWTAGACYVQNKCNQAITPYDLLFHDDYVAAKIIKPEALTERDFTLCFANGCYDIVHNAHINLLRFAKTTADKLVVALNSDASIQRLKGSDRPINSLQSRLFMLSNFDFVDYLVFFDEDTPYETIKKIMPNTIVKGGDWRKEQVVGHDIIPDVRIFPHIEGFSTTKIVNKLKNLSD